MPIAATPDWSKVSRLFFWIIAFALAQLAELHRYRRGDFAGRRLRKNSHAAVVVGVGARRRPGVVTRIRGDALETFGSHLTSHEAAELGVACNNLSWHVWFDRLRVRRQE